MKSTNQIELTAGLFLLLGIGALIFLSLQATGGASAIGDGSYQISANFTNVGGLEEGSDVNMAGVTIGTVQRIALDDETLNAQVTLSISERYDQLPRDTSAAIYTSGLLGSQYVALQPGGLTETLADGDKILLTQSAVVLEKLISKYMFNSETEKGG